MAISSSKRPHKRPRTAELPKAASQAPPAGAPPPTSPSRAPRCFQSPTGSDGAEALLEALARCPDLEDSELRARLWIFVYGFSLFEDLNPFFREELNLSDCEKIPAVAWQRLSSAQWRLKKASFGSHLGEESEVQGVFPRGQPIAMLLSTSSPC